MKIWAKEMLQFEKGFYKMEQKCTKNNKKFKKTLRKTKHI